MNPVSDTSGRDAKTKVLLHIGEPKTGTTFLQKVMWRNRNELARQGVLLAGHVEHDHFRATQDLRGIQHKDDDPAAPWDGEWDVLAMQAASADRIGVISHELLSSLNSVQIERAVTSLGDVEIHVLLTTRDMASLIPAEWQESIKHRNTRAWRAWIGDVVDTESGKPDRRRFWFWRVHDTAAILRAWEAWVPPERIHLMTMPQRGSDPNLLWERMAGLLEVDPTTVVTTDIRANESLGMPEIEFLRRLNHVLPRTVPDWYYMHNVKEPLAHRALLGRPKKGRLVLPEERMGWAKAYADELIEKVRSRGYDVIGDLEELRPQEKPGRVDDPDEATADEILDAAVAAVAGSVVQRFEAGAGVRTTPAAGTEVAHPIIGFLSRFPHLRQRLRLLGTRYRWAARLRVTTWKLLERSRRTP